MAPDTSAVRSRDIDRARAAAAAHARSNGGAIVGASNCEAAREAGIVVIAGPFPSLEATLAEVRDEVAGKIVVDTTVPLVPLKVMRVQFPPEGCAASRAQALLGEAAIVVSAFRNIAAHRLATSEPVECDVLVYGDSREARHRVIELTPAAGLRGLHAGSPSNSASAEALTSVLIFINKHYSLDGAGLRITGKIKDASRFAVTEPLGFRQHCFEAVEARGLEQAAVLLKQRLMNRDGRVVRDAGWRHGSPADKLAIPFSAFSVLPTRMSSAVMATSKF